MIGTPFRFSSTESGCVPPNMVCVTNTCQGRPLCAVANKAKLARTNHLLKPSVPQHVWGRIFSKLWYATTHYLKHKKAPSSGNNMKHIPWDLIKQFFCVHPPSAASSTNTTKVAHHFLLILIHLRCNTVILTVQYFLHQHSNIDTATSGSIWDIDIVVVDDDDDDTTN